MRMATCIVAAVVLYHAPVSAERLPVQRCINLSHGLEAPFEGAWGDGISDADLTAVAEAGFDTVRLPVRFTAGYTSGRINPVLLDRVEQIVAQATARGLSVIVDLHHFDELMEAPDRHGDMFVAIWSQIAARFAGAPDTLMFELLNEPAGEMTTRKAQALYDRVVPLLRQSHPDRWIVLGGGDYSSAAEVANLAPPGYRIAHTFHTYDPFKFTHQGAVWSDPVPPDRGPVTQDELDTVTKRIADAAEGDVPMLLGEFGVIGDVPDGQRATWIAAIRHAAEAADLPWCHWALDGNFPARDAETGSWKPAILDALID